MASERQKAVLCLIAHGESDQRIQAKLDLDQEALRECFGQLFKELGVETRVELVLFAYSKEGKELLEREAAYR